MHVKVAALQFRPSVILNIDKERNTLRADGVFGQLLDLIFCKINISYSILTPEDGQFGVKFRGNWTGMFGMILNKKADMILSPSIITSERMKIVKFSETLTREENCVLTTRGIKKYFYKDILVQFNSLDTITYLALAISTISVALLLSIGRKINFFRAFWMVLKAFFYKPIKTGLQLSSATFALMVYFLCIVFFWTNINQLIGANLITHQSDDIIDSIGEIVENVNIIPTVIKGSANEYLFRNQKETEMQKIWKRMRTNGEQGLISKPYRKTTQFIKSIIKRERVYIEGRESLKQLVIHFCQRNPKYNLFISKNFLTPSLLAFAFKLDFDQDTITKINKIIARIKSMGIINIWTQRAFRTETRSQKRPFVKFCIYRAIYSSNFVPKRIRGTLKDFVPVFKLFIFVIIISLIVFVIEITQKFIYYRYLFHVKPTVYNVKIYHNFKNRQKALTYYTKVISRSKQH